MTTRTAIRTAPRIVNEDPLMDPTDLGLYIGCSRPTARQLMLDGVLPIVWVRTRMLVRKSDVDAYIAAGGHRIETAS